MSAAGEPASREGFQVLGIEARTNNEFEADPSAAQIPSLWERFMSENMAESIPNQTEPGRIYAVYTDYEDGDDEDYSLVIGCAVDSAPSVPDHMVLVHVATGTYQRFVAEGEMPLAVVKEWGAIWEVFSDSETLRRTFTTDYEIHDANNDKKVDVYVSVEPV